MPLMTHRQSPSLPVGSVVRAGGDSSPMPRIPDDPAPSRPAYFWWLLANGLALCFAVISWAVCLHVFGNPEIPRNYAILRWLGRLPELKRYTVLDVPNGTLLDPKGLYGKFYQLNGEALATYNAQLVRNYLTNFQRPLWLTYIEGDYQVEQVRALGAEDFLPHGFAVRARAMIKPDDFTQPAPYPVVIEYLFPTTEVEVVREFRPGDLMAVRKSPNCAAILHVAHLTENDDAVIGLTVVPIAYGPYRVGDALTFGIEPPAEVRPKAGFPVFR